MPMEPIDDGVYAVESLLADRRRKVTFLFLKTFIKFMINFVLFNGGREDI